MTNTHPSLNPSRIEALLPLARGWLMVMACVLASLVGRARGRHRRLLTPFVVRLERLLRNWLFLQAHARVAPPLLARAPQRPLTAARGFRRSAQRGDVFWRAMRPRAPQRRTLAARLRFIHAVANDPARAVARLVKRLETIAMNGLVPPRLIAIGFVALSVIPLAPATRLRAADSS